MVAISPHADKVLFSDTFTTIWFSTKRSGKVIRKRFSPARPDAASFSVDAAMVSVATSDGKIHVFDSSSGAEVIPPLPASIHFLVSDLGDNNAGAEDTAWNITHLVFKKDNSALVATSSSGTTRIWNLKTQSVIQELRASYAESAIFTRDENSLITYGIDGAVKSLASPAGN